MEGLESVKKTAKTNFAEKMGSASAASPTQPVSGSPQIAQIAQELKAGQITPRQAADRVLDVALNKGAGATLSDRVREKLRADLEHHLQNDPYLAQRAKQIGLSED